jgi:serine/threonine-protein kinase HipA
LPYPGVDPKRAKLAMKIGGEYELHMIGPRQWRRFAEANRLDPDEMMTTITSIIRAAPCAIADELAACLAEGLNHPILEKLAGTLMARVRRPDIEMPG